MIKARQIREILKKRNVDPEVINAITAVVEEMHVLREENRALAELVDAYGNVVARLADGAIALKSAAETVSRKRGEHVIGENQ